ncbi:MAG: hypothetical protein OHK0024_25180 [Thalassobaculales bacterium]
MSPTRRTTLALLAAAPLGACGLFGSDKEPPPPPTTQVALQIAASPQLNPAVNGRASPVLVRIYELTEVGPFNEADFFALYEKDRDALGPTVLAQSEVVAQPGQVVNVPMRETRPETKAIGVFVAFRDYENASWRAATTITPLEKTTLIVNLLRLAVQISKPAG